MIYHPTETMDTRSALYYPAHEIFCNSSFSSIPLIISMNEISLQSSSSSSSSAAAAATHLPSLTTSPLGIPTPSAPMSPKSSLHLAVDDTNGHGNGHGSGGSGGQKSVHWENPHDVMTLNIWIDNLAMSATESTEFIQRLQEYFHY
jgi:hypothetical protein